MSLIDPLDPIMPLLALQYDLRERFLEALEAIVAVEVDGREYKAALLRCKQIASEAMDDEAIMEWEKKGRPLPGVEEKFGDIGRAVTAAVRAEYGIEPVPTES